MVAEERMAKQPNQELVQGCRVLNAGISKDPRFPRVVLCELPEPEGGFEEGADWYVVWYVDQHGKPSIGSYHQTREAALVVFQDRI